MGLLYQALYRFFVTMCRPLNKGEKDQPPPLADQEAHLRTELARVERERAATKLDARRTVPEPTSGKVLH